MWFSHWVYAPHTIKFYCVGINITLDAKYLLALALTLNTQDTNFVMSTKS